MRKTFIVSGLLFLGLLIGAALGGVGSFFYLKHRDETLWGQLPPADAAHARATRDAFSRIFWHNSQTVNLSPPKSEIYQRVEKQISGLQGIRATSHQPEIDPAVSVYLMFGYVRLARLENEKGNASKAGELMAKAEAECVNAGWKDCSAAILNSATENWVRGAAGQNAKPAGDFQ